MTHEVISLKGQLDLQYQALRHDSNNIFERYDHISLVNVLICIAKVFDEF
jgi:hypothetical protein